MEQIRCLKQQERQNTRAMYEAIFSEDSREFVDYYYRWKTRDNEILVLEDEKGYEVMMHFNPYLLRVNGRAVKAPYIVAVATRPDCRRQGKMYQVMERALRDLQRAHCPFAFLLPADPAYYRGQGFVFAPEAAADAGKPKDLIRAAQVTEKAGAGEAAAEDGIWNYVSLKSGDDARMQQAAETANEILAEQYDMYIQRDKGYYERLAEETAAEQGEVLLIEAGEKCIGILAYGKEEQADIKEFFLFRQYQELREEICGHIFGRNGWKEEEMRMMFRITDLQAWNGMLKGGPEGLRVSVTDEVVKENNGIWQLLWSPDGGSVTRLKDTEEEIRHMNIAEVTEKILEKRKIFIREWV